MTNQDDDTNAHIKTAWLGIVLQAILTLLELYLVFRG